MRAEDNAYLLRSRGEIFPVLVKCGIQNFLLLFLPPFVEAQLPVVCAIVKVTRMK